MSADCGGRCALDTTGRSLTTPAVQHPLFREVREVLKETMQSYRLILLAAPSGVGKGRLVQCVVDELNSEVGADLRSVWAVVVRTLAPTQGRFPWRDQSIRILEALDDPLPERKMDREEAADRLCPATRGCYAGLPSVRHARSSDDALRRAVRDAARDRGLRLLVLDEAYNLVNGVRGRRLANQLDVLRDLADQADFRILLVSTERILSNLDLSPELSRRLGFVYFPRYGATLDAHGRFTEPRSRLKEFSKTALQLMQRLPESARFSLSKEQYRFLFEGVHGCVGRLVHWFRRAIVRCVSEGASRLEWGHFERTAEPHNVLAAFREKCRQHETKVLEGRAQKPVVLRQKLLPIDEVTPCAKPGRRSPRVGVPAPTRHAETGFTPEPPDD